MIEELFDLYVKYTKEHRYTLELEIDGSGCITHWTSNYSIAIWNTPEEGINILKSFLEEES